MDALPRLYLAGPDVFFADAVARGAAKCAACMAAGLEGVFPLDTSLELAALAPLAQGYAIYRANIRLIDGCDGVLADLSPFRGTGADPGTAFELGYARGRGLPVFAYTLSPALYRERLEAAVSPFATMPDGRLGDRDGIAVEDFGMVDNLMLHAACLDAAAEHPARGEGAFEAALAQAAAYFARRREALARAVARPG
jgi:nucleoside 2-deoxyribosyltransferase